MRARGAVLVGFHVVLVKRKQKSVTEIGRNNSAQHLFALGPKIAGS